IWDFPKVKELTLFYQSNFLKDIFESNRVFALPKQTSKSEIQKQIFGNFTGFTDSSLFTTLLTKDEYILHPKLTLRYLKKRGNIGSNKTKMLIGSRDYILDFYSNEGFQFVYLRGYDWAPAIRIEIPNNYLDDTTRKSHIDNLISLIIEHMRYPELRQPYLMYIVDLLAKELYMGSIAMKSAINDPIMKDILSRVKVIGLLFQDYRG
ncbi:MAG: hypothetical protein OEY49_17180, partial [Candidatus Heimdallarchaeota archaeon]|nr:hypothetical protein [Candidatus Heimdallarchaeota archaeon]